MIIFQTKSGSVYQLNNDSKQIRRLSGIVDPQPRQGKDGEWKSFIEIIGPTVGSCTYIFWDPKFTPLHSKMLAVQSPATVTSIVISIMIDNSLQDKLN